MRDNYHLVRARSRKGSQMCSKSGSDSEVNVAAVSQDVSDLQHR